MINPISQPASREALAILAADISSMAALIQLAALAGDKDGVHDGLRSLASANSLWSQMSMYKEGDLVLNKLHEQMNTSFKSMKRRGIDKGYARDEV